MAQLEKLHRRPGTKTCLRISSPSFFLLTLCLDGSGARGSEELEHDSCARSCAWLRLWTVRCRWPLRFSGDARTRQNPPMKTPRFALLVRRVLRHTVHAIAVAHSSQALESSQSRIGRNCQERVDTCHHLAFPSESSTIRLEPRHCEAL